MLSAFHKYILLNVKIKNPLNDGNTSLLFLSTLYFNIFFLLLSPQKITRESVVIPQKNKLLDDIFIKIFKSS